jgi:hypothetical protein
MLSAAAGAIILLTLTTACSSGSGGGNSLQAALGRVSDTANTRTQIWYDDTAALVKLAGRAWASQTGFALLRGMGAFNLAPEAELLPAGPGINLLNEDYAISAGQPPREVGLVEGGQDAGRIKSGLSRLGWKPAGGKLVAPPAGSVRGSTAAGPSYTLHLAQVMVSGADVSYGDSQADLSQIGQPSGQTLAQDPRISALADCLGNVVASSIGIYNGGEQPAPAEVAVGIRSPASNTAAPRAVACVSWPSAAAASTYQANLRKALLGGGMSLTRDEPFSRLLTRATLHNVGGAQHVIAWQAATPGNAILVFSLLASEDLPALPDCRSLPPTDQGHISGCS